MLNDLKYWPNEWSGCSRCLILNELRTDFVFTLLSDVMP
jgi:hypothetical protein